MNYHLSRLQTELEHAQKVQLSLLPKEPPCIEGIDLWAASWQASHVGGDFYDFMPRRDPSFTFAVGDISGKGMPAALLMPMMHAMIRTAFDSLPVPSPETILTRSNAKLYDDLSEAGMFATVFIGQYDLRRKELLYANAGHSPVIYCPVGGNACLLVADGTAVGILPESLSRDHSLQLYPGDVFIVGTDGLNESRNRKDIPFGYGRLLRLVEKLACGTAQEIAEGLYCTIKAFSKGKSQRDDQTLVILKFTG